MPLLEDDIAGGDVFPIPRQGPTDHRVAAIPQREAVGCGDTLALCPLQEPPQAMKVKSPRLNAGEFENIATAVMSPVAPEASVVW